MSQSSLIYMANTKYRNQNTKWWPGINCFLFGMSRSSYFAGWLAFIPRIWKAAASGCDDKDICHCDRRSDDEDICHCHWHCDDKDICYVCNFSVLCHILCQASIVFFVNVHKDPVGDFASTWSSLDIQLLAVGLEQNMKWWIRWLEIGQIKAGHMHNMHIHRWCRILLSEMWTTV